MCGIVGILGKNEVAPLILETLKRLEYRGYDSAGIATVKADGSLDRRRAEGKLIELSDKLVHNALAGKSGIGHTRWATHGAATEMNSHPHQSRDVAVVHNGTIENFEKLYADLAKDGITPQSETDTETVVLLVQRLLDAGVAPFEATNQVIEMLEGSFALCLLFKGERDLMIVARKGSPMAIGKGDGEVFAGSDAIALALMTTQITYLEEGDRAILTRDKIEIYDQELRLANRPVKTVKVDPFVLDKMGHKHFMSKEIAEQPGQLKKVIDGYRSTDGKSVQLPDKKDIDFSKIDRITMVACGTAYYACCVAKYWFETLAGLPVDVDVGSEFRYRNPPLSKNSYAVFVSQSGETADTLKSLLYCVDKVDKIISIVNVAESSVERESDVTLPIFAGTEVSVASTKAFTCQLAVLHSLALLAAKQRGKISAKEEASHLQNLRNLPAFIERAVKMGGEIEQIAKKVAEARDVLFLGRGSMFPLALEGALKLKEISYIHAEGYASGELKHGPIALVDKDVPIVIMAPTDELFDKTISNMREVMARGGRVILMTDAEGAKAAGGGIWKTLILPTIDPLLAPILYAVPAQLLSYHTAVAKGTDVDQPRNLAKSVTVE